MPSIRFSLCQACDCKSFDFYDTTGLAPGLSTGYTGNPSTYSGLVKFKDDNGDFVGEYVVTPSGDATIFFNIPFDKDLANTLGDGSYIVDYEVRDSSGALVGKASQSVIFTCSIMCDIENLAAQYLTANGKAEQIVVEKINEASQRVRMAKILANIGQQQLANSQLKIAKDYV